MGTAITSGVKTSPTGLRPPPSAPQSTTTTVDLHLQREKIGTGQLIFLRPGVPDRGKRSKKRVRDGEDDLGDTAAVHYWSMDRDTQH